MSKSIKVILVSISIISLGYFVYITQKPDVPKEEIKTDGQNLTNDAANIQPETNIPASNNNNLTPIVENDGKAVDTSDWKTYRNEKYGFELKFPPSWNGHVVESKELELAGIGKYDSINFGFDIQKSLFNINVFTIAQWDKSVSLEISSGRPKPNYISKNEKYYFNVAGAQYTENQEMSDRMNEIGKILSTFKLTDDNEPFSCGMNMVKDIDGNTYKTVKIGSQCWMKENIKVTKNTEGKAITRYCYNDDPNNCNTDGGLYDWNTAMNNSTKDGAQGICPNGWHVPKDSEWYVLESGLAAGSCDANRSGWGCDQAGTKLKSGGVSGFDGILAGFRYMEGFFRNRGTYTYLWSSTEDGADAWGRSLNSDYITVNRYTNGKADGFSIRCLQN